MPSDWTINYGEMFTITWLNADGIEIDHELWQYGTTPTHEAPSIPSTEEYMYLFTGWTPDVVAVTGDATYMATFDEQPIATSLDQITNDQSPITNKILRNNQLFILRGDRIYTITGQEIK